MIPNKWVILWNDKPVGIRNFDGGPFKTENINEIMWWDTREQAENWMSEVNNSRIGTDRYICDYTIVNIQFRIMEK